MEALRTRDSQVWKVLFWGGTVMAILIEAINVIDPVALGLSLHVLAWLRLIYAVIIGVSGKMGLSLLPSKEETSLKARLSKLAPLVLLAVAMSAAACQRPITIVTPQGQVAYTANEVLKRVQTLQTATIAAEANGGLPTAVARVIVTCTTESAKVLASTPNGWGPTVVTLWGTAKMQIPIKYLTDPVIAAAVTAVDVALAVFLPPGGLT